MLIVGLSLVGFIIKIFSRLATVRSSFSCRSVMNSFIIALEVILLVVRLFVWLMIVVRGITVVDVLVAGK